MKSAAEEAKEQAAAKLGLPSINFKKFGQAQAEKAEEKKKPKFGNVNKFWNAMAKPSKT